MTTKIQRQMEAQLAMYEKAQAQLNGTLQAFNLMFAAAARAAGGKLFISASDIDAVGGREIRIDKDEEGQQVVITLVPEDRETPDPLTVVDPDDDTTELPFDPGKPPSKFENPFIMENEGLNPPGMGQSGPAIKLTDL